MAIPQLGTDNFNVKTLLCDLYNGINSITPLMLGGTEEQTAAKITWALDKLDGVGLGGTVLGCPKGNISPNGFYPHRNRKGGPLNPPPSVYKNTGNNVYNKVYFTKAPTQSQCKAGSA